jgi:tRNA-dihydrouridine synthase C
VDLNFGCPARTVNRHDGGATLLQYPDRIYEIVAAVRTAVPEQIPVSAKLRLGWDNIDAIHRNAERAAQGGANWITVHARTKSQGYRPPAYWKPLGEVRARLPIPIVANGEIWTLDDLRRCRDETGCQHFMLGRGAIADPTLGRRAARELGMPSFGKTPAEWPSLIAQYCALCHASGLPPTYILGRVKQWLRMRNRDGSMAICDQIARCQNIETLLIHLGHCRRLESSPLTTAAQCPTSHRPESVQQRA